MKTGKRILYEQLNQLIKNLDFKQELTNNIEKVLKSGAIEPSEIKEGDFLLAHAIICVTLENSIEKHKPLTKEARKLTNNLRHFI